MSCHAVSQRPSVEGRPVAQSSLLVVWSDYGCTLGLVEPASTHCTLLMPYMLPHRNLRQYASLGCCANRLQKRDGTTHVTVCWCCNEPPLIGQHDAGRRSTQVALHAGGLFPLGWPLRVAVEGLQRSIDRRPP